MSKYYEYWVDELSAKFKWLKKMYVTAVLEYASV